MGQNKLKPETVDEHIVVMWQQGQTAFDIARVTGWSHFGVRTRVSQLRALGVPLDRRTVRVDLDQLKAELDLDRLTALALAAKGGI